MGLRHREDPRGQALQVRGAHPGQRGHRDGRHGRVPAQDQAGLQDDRGHQPGLRLGPRLVGDLPQHAAGDEARREDRGRAVPEVRRG